MSPSVTPPLTAAVLMEKAGPAYISDMVQLMQQLNTMLQMQRCIARNSVVQAIASAVLTKLTFDTDVFDIGSLHDVVTNNTRFYAVNTGFYSAIGSVEFEPAAGGTVRAIAIQVNGASPMPTPTVTAPPNAAAITCLQVTGLFQLTAGDYVEFVVLQDSGGPVNTVVNTTFGSLVLESRM